MTPYWCPLHMIVNVKLSMHEKIQDFGHESSKGVGAWVAHKANEEKRINLARIALFFSLMGNLHNNKTQCGWNIFIGLHLLRVQLGLGNLFGYGLAVNFALL